MRKWRAVGRPKASARPAANSYLQAVTVAMASGQVVCVEFMLFYVEARGQLSSIRTVPWQDQDHPRPSDGCEVQSGQPNRAIRILGKTPIGFSSSSRTRREANRREESSTTRRSKIECRTRNPFSFARC